jgi:hypothetical protein
LVQPENGRSSTHTPIPTSNLGNGNYQFSFKLKNGNWDPSSSNSFYFEMVDSGYTDSLANGYAVGVNAKGSTDMVSVWTIREGAISDLVAETTLDWGANQLVQVDVVREVSGIWKLTATDLSAGIAISGSGFNTDYPTINRIGLNFNFTQTRSGQLWFDDLLILRENTPPAISKIKSLRDGTILVCFSEPINTGMLTTENFLLNDTEGNEIVIEQINILSTDSIQLTTDRITIPDLFLSVFEIEDEEGLETSILDFPFEFRFTLFNRAILINEILFNPKSGGSDFVELYNQSGFNVDLSTLRLATRNDTLGLKSIYPLSTKRIDFPNQSYFVFTKDSLDLATNYWVPTPGLIITMKNFPTYSDDGGRVVLLNDSLEVIDEFAYNKSMHSKFIADQNGVSLERLSFEGETNSPENWHSASSVAGFATPGYENSQQEPEKPVAASVLISPDAISPNGDGYNDEMEITFRLEKAGYLINIFVFDVNGRRVNRLLNNAISGSELKSVFDGKSENGTLLPTGFYILLAELVHPDGEKKVFKKPFLVTDKR